MEYRTLGGTGIKVSHFCLGAMMFGPMGNPDHDECVKITHAALDAGVNFIDTSDSYSDGESERILAKALKGRRDRVVLATKCFFPPGRVGLSSRTGQHVNDGGGSRRWIVRAVEDSLRRLETDYIDVYQLHRRDWDTELEESLAAMTDLQRAGKIRVLGASATPAEWIVEAQRIAEQRQLARVRSEQCIYSMLSRKVEEGVLPTCHRHGVGVMVYAPLAGGWLTGKYRRNQPPPAGSRSGRALELCRQESESAVGLDCDGRRHSPNHCLPCRGSQSPERGSLVGEDSNGVSRAGDVLYGLLRSL